MLTFNSSQFLTPLKNGGDCGAYIILNAALDAEAWGATGNENKPPVQFNIFDNVRQVDINKIVLDSRKKESRCSLRTLL